MDDQALIEDHERPIVAAIFAWGLLLASLAMVAGVLLGFVSGDTALRSLDVAHPGDMSPASALTGLGIGILAATPVAHIAALMYLWARQRRFKPGVGALTVLLTLVMARGLGGGMNDG